MNLSFYALGRARPTLTISHVDFFDIWAAMKSELSDYYEADSESFEMVETSLSGEDAEVVTLDGRIVGALDRALTQDDVAAIWGVNRMEKRAFVNRIRSLYNIDGHLLPELSVQQQLEFLRNPVRFFLESDELQSDAIMREIERRQPPAERIASGKVAPPATTKVARPKKAKGKVEGQTELLLPIVGGKRAADSAELASKATPARRKAG